MQYRIDVCSCDFPRPRILNEDGEFQGSITLRYRRPEKYDKMIKLVPPLVNCYFDGGD